MLVQSFDGGFPDGWVVGEAQIIIGAEIEDFALRDADLGPLRTEDLPLGFVEAGRTDLRKPLRDSFLSEL